MTYLKSIRAAANGQWLQILCKAGISAELLDGKGHPCPKCGGTDRFAAFKDVAETGGVICRKCHSKKNGDGFATIQWYLGLSFRDAVDFVGRQLGLPRSLRARSKDRVNSSRQIDSVYDYCDEDGKVLFQVVRYSSKKFKQRRHKPEGGWAWNTKGIRPVPFRLPELLADPTKLVFVVEGEKDVLSLTRFGLVATCNAGGAGKWLAEHSELLRGRDVIIIPDNDDAGYKHAQKVAQSLQGIAKSVHILELPNLPEKGDVSDWIEAGGSKVELLRLADAAPLWVPAKMRPWPQLARFNVLDLPEFPTHALPQPLRDWVESESHATQTPADLAAFLSLSVCSACIARRVEVEPRTGWREPVNLFTAVLLEPGNRKSAVFSDAVNPLRELEAELIEVARPTVAHAQSDRRQDECKLRKLEKIAGEKHGDEAAHARHDAGNLAAVLAETAEPVLPRLIVDDATAEKLGMMLAEQSGRIASMSPEGGVFDLMAGLYSKSGIPQFGVYLMGHSGDDLVTDRVGRKSVFVARPALTCGYAMQPSVIAGLAENPAFRGRGLLARFLYAAPRSWIGRREIAPQPVSNLTREAYRQIVRSLGLMQGETVLQISAEASAMFREWESEIEAMLGDGGRMETMRDWGAKLAGATLRLAAVLHCVEHGPTGHIEGLTIAAAIEIAHYLIPHAEAVLNMMSAKDDPAFDDAQYLLGWITRHGLRVFTKTEAQHHGKARFPKADDIDPALSELTRRGYIRPKPAEVTGPGRPPSPAYEVNPAAFEVQLGKHSHDLGNIGSALNQPKTIDRVRVAM